MSKFLKDLKFGLNKEMQLLPILKEYLKDETIYKLENTNVFDFKGDNKVIELKSRNNNYDKYSTTMIGINKILRASSLNENVYFFFCFNDGLYFWLYDKDYEFEIKRGGRYDRGKIEVKEYCYIPIEMLIKVY